MKLRERRGYVVLALICIFSCLATILISIQDARNETRKFCLVLSVQIQYPPPRPPILTAHNEAVEKWLVYVNRVKVFNDLGC